MSDVEELQAEELALLEEEKHMLEGDLEDAHATIKRLTAENERLQSAIDRLENLTAKDAAIVAAALAQIKGGETDEQ